MGQPEFCMTPNHSQEPEKLKGPVMNHESVNSQLLTPYYTHENEYQSGHYNANFDHLALQNVNNVILEENETFEEEYDEEEEEYDLEEIEESQI